LGIGPHSSFVCSFDSRCYHHSTMEVMLQFVRLSVSISQLITVMRHWLVFRPACLTVSSPSSTRQVGRSPVSIARSILQMLSPVSTGFERASASSSNWRSLYTELFTALHISTYRARFSTSPICRRDVEAGCDRRPPVVSLTSVRHDLLGPFTLRTSTDVDARQTSVDVLIKRM